MKIKFKTTLKVVLIIVALILSYILFGILGVALRSIIEGMSTERIQLGNDYYLTLDPSWGYPLITDTNNNGIICMEIVSWNFDSIFIIVKQKPFFQIYDSISNKHSKMSATEKDVLYKKIQQFNYWIIDKRKETFSFDEINSSELVNNRYGPFTYEEYLKKRRELNMPDSFQLKKFKEWF